jgi:signal transduction histidine kinase
MFGYRARTPTSICSAVPTNTLWPARYASIAASPVCSEAVALNDMLARLQESLERLRDFYPDLAHELRTPITNLMTETQVVLTQASSQDEYRDLLASNMEEFERLARMMSDMLFLAKADNGLIVPSREKVDSVE